MHQVILCESSPRVPVLQEPDKPLCMFSTILWDPSNGSINAFYCVINITYMGHICCNDVTYVHVTCRLSVQQLSEKDAV